MMCLPTELTLRTTKDGPRLFNVPIKESEQLFTPLRQWNSLKANEANELLKEFENADCLRIRTTFKLSHATSAGFNLFGQQMLTYDLNPNTINGVFYSPDDMTSMEITADIYIDRTSIEVFVDNGAYSFQWLESRIRIIRKDFISGGIILILRIYKYLGLNQYGTNNLLMV